jgi:hypothetical protein
MVYGAIYSLLTLLGGGGGRLWFMKRYIDP